MQSDSEESSFYSSSECGSSGNEADSEGEDYMTRKYVDRMIEQLNNFQPYMYEPERVVSNTSSSNEDSSTSGSDSEDIVANRIGNTEWCDCQNCKKETREIDCLCCQEVAALNLKFDNSSIACILDSQEFSTLCLNEYVLKNVLTGLHVSRGDYLENECTNRSLRYAAYKQFIWWIFKSLGKGNRRVIPSCVIWKIRDTFPECDGQYTLYFNGHKD